MHELWMGLLTALGAGVTTATAAAVRFAWRTSKQTGQMLEDWNGTEARPGVPGRAGVMERLQAGDRRFASIDNRLGPLESGMEHLLAEIRPNGIRLSDKLDAIYRFVQQEQRNQLAEVNNHGQGTRTGGAHRGPDQTGSSGST